MSSCGEGSRHHPLQPRTAVPEDRAVGWATGAALPGRLQRHLEFSNPVKAFPLSLLFTQRRSHWIRLPTYQPKMLAIRKRIAIDGSAKGLIQFKSLIASIIQSEEYLSQSKNSP